MHARLLHLTAGLLLWNLSGAVPALANGGGYVEGLASTGAFKPFGVGQVEMVSEHLEIDLHIEYADVRIDYVLHNPGAKVTVEAGFPSAKSAGYDRAPEHQTPTKAELAALGKLEDFELKADGTKLKVTTRPDNLKLPASKETGEWGSGAIVNSWHIFRLDFDKGQTRRLQVRYRNPYHCVYDYVSDDQRIGPLTLTYLFSSAASWSGPIKQGTVILRTVSADPKLIQLSHPKRFQREGNTWTWSFTDFKPTLEDDLVVTVRPGYFGQSHGIPGRENIDDGRFVGNSYIGWGARLHFESESKLGGRWELQRHDYEASASSTLAPHGKTHYDAKFLAAHDEDSSAWVEGVKGDGIGESVTLTLPQPAKVRRVAITNGYAKSDDLYFANNRVAELAVSVNGGPPANVAIPDERLTREQYYFDLPPTEELVKTVKLTIAKVYKGARHDDTCISEVALVVPLEKEPEIRPAR